MIMERGTGILNLWIKGNYQFWLTLYLNEYEFIVMIIKLVVLIYSVVRVVATLFRINNFCFDEEDGLLLNCKLTANSGKNNVLRHLCRIIHLQKSTYSHNEFDSVTCLWLFLVFLYIWTFLNVISSLSLYIIFHPISLVENKSHIFVVVTFPFDWWQSRWGPSNTYVVCFLTSYFFLMN